MGPKIYPRLYPANEIAEALSHKAGVSSICSYSTLAFMISGMTGTISKLIDRPVSISPKHIRDISL